MYDRTVLTAILKEDYAPALVEMFKRENILFDLLMAGPKEDIRGLELYIPIEVNRNPTGGPGSDQAAYPTAGNPTLKAFKVLTAIYRNLLEVPITAQEDTSSPTTAYLRAVEKAMQDCTKGLKTAVGRDLYGTRMSCLGVVNVNGGAGVLTIYHAYTSSEDELLGTSRMLKGAYVNVVDPLTGTIRVDAGGSPQFQVSSITNITTVTLSAAPVGCVQGDILVPEGAIDSLATIGNGIYGLGEVIANGVGIFPDLWGSYGGLDRSLYPEMNSVVLDMNGGAIADTDLENAHLASLQASGEMMTPSNGLLLMHPSERQLVKAWRKSDIRFQPKQAQQGLEDSAVSYNFGDGDLPLVSDRMAIPHCIWGINRDWYKVYEVSPISLDSNDGGELKIKRGAGGALYDILQGMMRTRLQTFASKPHAHFKIVNSAGADEQFGQGVTWVKPA